MRKHIVLISCVSKKLDHPAKVRDIYVSTLFRLNLKYAESLHPNKIYVLSAKHGLLSMETVIEPYEQTLNTMPVDEIRHWAKTVVRQLKGVCSIGEAEFTFLAGEKYRKHLIPHINHYNIPFRGLPIGKQLQKLKELTS